MDTAENEHYFLSVGTEEVNDLNCRLTLDITPPTAGEGLATSLLPSGLQSMSNPGGIPPACNMTRRH